MLEAQDSDTCGGSYCADAECGCGEMQSANAVSASKIMPIARPARPSVVRLLNLDDYAIALIFVIAWINGIYLAYTA